MGCDLDPSLEAMTAVYDFSTSRVSYDFFGFLSVAELERKQRGCHSLHLILVPADGDGFHPNVQYGLAQKKWRLRQIIIEGCWLLPSCRHLVVCQDRDEARRLLNKVQSNLYPFGYSVDSPNARWESGYSFVEGHKGNDPRVLRASDQARTYMSQWLTQASPNKQIVSLTLREASHNKKRNISRSEWVKFANWLKRSDYTPVFVPDTELAATSLTQGYQEHLTCEIAAVNIDLRMALYEHSFLNVNVTNGPAQLCGLSSVSRCLTFVTGDWLHDEPTPFLAMGLDRGETPSYFSQHQKFVWREPKGETLVDAFNQFLADTKLSPLTPGQLPNPEPIDTSNHRDLMEIAQRYLSGREWELFDDLSSYLLRNHPESYELYYLTGLAAHARRNPNGIDQLRYALMLIEYKKELKKTDPSAVHVRDHILEILSRIDDK